MALINGTSGNDTLTGTSGADDVNGLGGNDRLYGGAGNDVLDGGDGTDWAMFDTVTVNQTISLLVAGAQDTGEGFDTLIGIENLWGGSGDDVLTGDGGNNNLVGWAGSDQLMGGLGNDRLGGGVGADEMTGGGGDDTYSVDAQDAIFENAGEGVDTVQPSLSYTLPDHFENMTFLNWADDLVGAGNGAANVLTGDSMRNILNGMGGADTLIGGYANDTLDGGDGDDILFGDESEDALTGGAGNDTLYSGSGLQGFSADLLDGGAGDDTYIINNRAQLTDAEGTDAVVASVNVNLIDTTIEKLTLVGTAWQGYGNALANEITASSPAAEIFGFEGDDSLIGAAAGDLLSGGEGNDRLTGNGGNDRLFGGDGVDRMYGGLGNDLYEIDRSGDFTIERAGAGTDTVQSSVSHSLRANIEKLTLTGSGNGTGNELDNEITGSFASNKLLGLDGDDRLVGGLGSDTLDGGTGLDKLFGGDDNDVYVVASTTDQLVEYAGGGTDTVLASVTRSLGANFERLTLTGTANVSGTGNSYDNLMKGNAGANVLAGRGGNDKLYAYDGADVLKGEDGNDLLEGGTGRDRFYGGTGADSYVFRDGDFGGITSSTADQIHDFNDAEGDRVRLSLVDANSGVAGDQAFALIGTSAFTGVAGQLRYQQISGNTYVQGDTNGDGTADFWIRLDGLHTLASDDFIF